MNYTQSFFSSYGPDFLFEQVIKNMNEQGLTFTPSDTHWKINFNVEKKIEGTDPSDGAAAGETSVKFSEQCQASVEILKVPGKEKYCVNFSRKAGSSMLFYDSANKYMDLLEVCNNTMLDED